ncbi:hypothetical protein EJB05_02549, partial [Eragrostis curvula]
MEQTRDQSRTAAALDATARNPTSQPNPTQAATRAANVLVLLLLTVQPTQTCRGRSTEAQDPCLKNSAPAQPASVPRRRRRRPRAACLLPCPACPPHITQPPPPPITTAQRNAEAEQSRGEGDDEEEEIGMKLRPLSSARTAPSPLGPGPAASERRTVVVALRRDATGRELLTWALVKAAAAGDRVVALHVAAASSAAEEEEGPASAAAADTLASVLGAYKAFCERNQIDLELRVCEGASSVKRALVAEAAASGAAHLVLGVTNSSSTRQSRSSGTAVARYCAKRVPPTCAVTAVSNGVVVYRRDAAAEHHHKHQQQLSPSNSMVDTPRRLYRKILDATTTTTNAGEDKKAQDDLAIGDGRSVRRNMSVSVSALVSPRLRLLGAPPARCCQRKQEEELPEAAAGWPLLRKEIKSAVTNNSSPSEEEVSVVQWAMKLPTRWSSAAIAPVSSELKVSDDREVVPSEMSAPVAVIEEEEKHVPEELVEIREKYSAKYTMFSYNELAKITDNFSPDRVVGKGGAGRVYRARSTQDGGDELAVKVLKPSADVLTEFVAEIDILSAVDHDNAMSLVGLCLDAGADRLMLVYDYMRRGSLEEVLHGETTRRSCKGGAAFGWPERFKVAVGVARALAYLHGDDSGGGERRPVIHRDVKSSNVLVADDFQPKLCDFGLAIWAADAASQVTGDDVAGTFGYLAPEYFMHGKVSDKIDVYAFGVVLLELVSGRKPVSAGGPKGQESLVMWATSVVHGGKLMDLVDPSLPPPAAGGEVERMALAAALCIRREPQRRPTMSNVLKLLAGDGDAVKWAKSEIGVSGDDHDDCGVATSPDKNDIQSYINLALLDDDDGSVSSVDFLGANMSLEEYMKGRWSRSSSFDD